MMPGGGGRHESPARYGAAAPDPVTLRQAHAFVAAHHRHLPPPAGHRFSIGAATDTGELVGVVIVGRPVARHLDDGVTAEAIRLATTGPPNTCSLLLAAAWHAARALGYRRLITYTRTDEPGTSLRAAGFHTEATVPANRGWSRPGRTRTNHGADRRPGCGGPSANPAPDRRIATHAPSTHRPVPASTPPRTGHAG